MKKTLVIHPDDRSTDFLKIIYENHLEDWTIMNNCFISKEELMNLINSHDRIIMMGHGTPSGLLNPKRWNFLIDDSFADLLKTKETISIWCHSNQYFEKHDIKGFHTGMIISEVSEARYVLGETPLNRQQTLDNMINFSRIVKNCIDYPPIEMKDYILKNYTFKDKVTQFNRGNIIVI